MRLWGVSCTIYITVCVGVTVNLVEPVSVDINFYKSFSLFDFNVAYPNFVQY